VSITLCHQNDIPEGESRGFELPQINLMAIRKRGIIYLYLNRCPHLGIPLDWEPHRFLDNEGQYIRCMNHGALFTIDEGECILGPCAGQSLMSVEYQLEDGNIIIPQEALPAVR